MNSFMKAINGMTMLTLIIVCLIATLFTLVVVVTSFRDNSLYRFCGGLAVTWATVAIGRASSAFIKWEMED